MVRALLDGRKTQTRRLASSPLVRCAIGDRLYVRETWNTFVLSQDLETSWPTSEISKTDPTKDAEGRHHIVLDYPIDGLPGTDSGKGPWRPSIHMPRWASRLTLVVEDVRLAPLQSISRDDSIAEGLRLSSAVIEEFWRWPEPYDAGHWLSPPAAYAWLWGQLHTDEGERWEDNPEVVALTFRVVRCNIDRVPA